jgi:hypothetical protein
MFGQSSCDYRLHVEHLTSFVAEIRVGLPANPRSIANWRLQGQDRSQLRRSSS